ncbi:MAG: glycosyltransferase family 39 protein [Vicinamibacterales bacterium]
MMAAAAIALPTLAAAFVLRRGGRPWPLCAALALPCAIGLSSLVWWLLLWVLPSSATGRIAIDTAIWLLAAWCWRPRSLPRERTRRLAWLRTPSALLCLVVCAVAVTAFAATSRVQPHGEWDAWAIWNLRARFLFLATNWRDGLSPLMPWSHPDYPLLLPLSVARIWTYAGHDTQAVPIALAALFAATSVAIVGISVGTARSASLGWYAAAAVAGSPAFIRYTPSQCADLPLAAYVLVSVLSLGEGLTTAARAPWVMAGIGAGLAAWTKNEGLVFCLLIIAAAVLAPCPDQTRSRATRCGYLVVGTVPMLGALGLLKLITPSNDLLAAGTLSSALSHLHELDRWQTVAGRFWHELWYSGASLVGVLPAVVAFVGLRGLQKPVAVGPATGLAVVALLVTTYALVYVVTPQDLEWHLNTSVDRVLLQVYPAAIWCAMMLVRS